MNSHRSVRLGFLIATGVVLAWLVMSETTAAAAEGPFAAKIIASRNRVQPGGLVEFKFELINAEGKSHPIPRSGSLAGSNPKLALYDSQGEEIGIYNFRFG